MPMRLLRASDHKRMPWKNGGGETIEIAVFPPAASVNDFDWRISMATVASDGPFSIFPGIDRTLSILKGDGILLEVEGSETTLTPESLPFPFPADAKSAARLASSAVTDLNVMTRRSQFTHHVERMIIADQTIITTDSCTRLIFCAEGQIETAVDSNKVSLSKHDCALLTESNSDSLILLGPSLLYLISIIKI